MKWRHVIESSNFPLMYKMTHLYILLVIKQNISTANLNDKHYSESKIWHGNRKLQAARHHINFKTKETRTKTNERDLKQIASAIKINHY